MLRPLSSNLVVETFRALLTAPQTQLIVVDRIHVLSVRVVGFRELFVFAQEKNFVVPLPPDGLPVINQSRSPQTVSRSSIKQQ